MLKLHTIRFIALCLTLGSSVLASPFAWTIHGDCSLEMHHESDETLVRFLFDPQPADPHFDLLKTVGGPNLLWVGPGDHPWHYGQWFSWKYINGVNFWETNGKTGQSDGLTEVSEPEVQIEGATARISYTRYYRLKPGQDPVLKDDFTIKITAPDAACMSSGPIIDWSVTTTALTEVTLDRTPLPEEPGGKHYGGYGGLSWRGAKALTEVQFVDSEGRKGMAIHRQRSRWVSAVGKIEGKPAGIAILAPTPDSEQDRSWYIYAEKKHPFWYINPAIVQPKPISLEKGASLIHEYCVIAHDGSWSPKLIR